MNQNGTSKRSHTNTNDHGVKDAVPSAKRVLRMDDENLEEKKELKSNGHATHSNPLPSASPPPYQVRSLTALYRDSRRTNDEIHSSISLGPVMTCLIDTPPMQRLRGLKQLGCAEFVYMNCNHNRFEHSLGVAHLAEMLCRRIRLQQPSLRCTEKDVLCVQIAGLLHDIGHGPFSHSYEDFVHRDLPQFIQKHPDVRSIYQDAGWPDVPPGWTHEMASLMMIDAALAHLGLAIDLQHLDKPLKQIGNGIDARSMRATRHPSVSTTSEEDDCLILSSRDWIFVKECIWGQPIPEIETVLGPGFHGRTQEYQDWLYDIVSNRHSGLDVDKVDYFARDRRRALRDSGEINKVMIEEAIVAWAECSDPATCPRCVGKKTAETKKHLMICYPDKMIGPSMNFFKTRFELHSILYKHKTNVAVAFMISDILCLADPYFPISIASFSKKHAGGSNGAAKPEYDSLPLSRAMLHPLSYLRLRDSVIDQIIATTCPELEPARQLVYRLWSRDLYKCAVSKVLKIHKTNSNDRRIWNLPSAEIVKDIVGLGGVHGCDNGGTIGLTEQDVIVHKCDIHHGRKSQDPLSKMRFVEKSQLNKISCDYYKSLPEAKTVPEDEYDSFLPKTLMECSLRIYCRDSAKVDLLRHAFEAWWDNANSEMDLTPGPASPHRNKVKKKRLPVLSQDSDDDTMEEEHFHDEVNASMPPWCSPN